MMTSHPHRSAGFTLIEIVMVIVIIVPVNTLLAKSALQESAGRKAVLLCTTVWCLDTPSIVVCSGFTATRSLLNHFTAATNWTLL